METWDYAHCLPYFKRMETCLAAEPRGPVPRARRAARAGARTGDQPAVRRVLRGGAAGRLPADRRRQRLPPGGLRAVRSQHPQRRRLSAARAYLHPVMHRPNLDGRRPARSSRRSCSRGRGRWAWSTRTGAATSQRVRAGEVVLCGGAINSPQTLQLSGVGQRRASAGARHRRRRRRAGRRREPAGPPRGLHPVRVQAARVGRALHEDGAPAVGRRQWLLLRRGPGRDEPLRGRGVRAQQRGRRATRT